MVGEGRVELPRPIGLRILSPVRLPFRHSPLFVAQHARGSQSLDENTKRVIPPFARFCADSEEYFNKEKLFFQFFRFGQENRVVYPFLLQPQTVGKDYQSYLAN